jgi:osmoprotectant transport system substrate-binding protein
MIRRRWPLAVLVSAALVTAACGNDKSTATAKNAVPVRVTIGSFNFSESIVLAEIYRGALEKAGGFKVTMKTNLGSREVTEPALERGEIDILPEYLGNALSFLSADAAKPGDDAQATLTKLRDFYTKKNITVLDPSPATDGDSIAVTKATADKYHLTKISDLAPVASQLILGGPPECATRMTCKAGLEQVYGLHFKDFKSLDAGGPLTKTALDRGDIQVARLFSSDPSIAAKGYVLLDDDKHIQLAGNVVPVVRKVKASAALAEVLNKVSSTMTTAQLLEINKKLNDDKADPTAVAADWLKEYGA